VLQGVEPDNEFNRHGAASQDTLWQIVKEIIDA